MWDKGPIIDLGALGGPYGNAAAIAENGYVAGVGETASGERRAFV
jgi:hypothetical protein